MADVGRQSEAADSVGAKFDLLMGRCYQIQHKTRCLAGRLGSSECDRHGRRLHCCDLRSVGRTLMFAVRMCRFASRLLLQVSSHGTKSARQRRSDLHKFWSGAPVRTLQPSVERLCLFPPQLVAEERLGESRNSQWFEQQLSAVQMCRKAH
jgi:hypothetical protein